MSTSTPKSQNSTPHQTPTANSEQASQEARASDLSFVTAASEINNSKDSSSNSSSNGSSNISKNSSSGSISSSAHPTTSTESGEDRTYSEVSQIQGPWLTPKHAVKKFKKKMENELLQETRKQQNSPVLKAAKLEPGVTLYIHNIHMHVGSDRTGVLNMVKKYANRDDDPTAAIRIKKGTVITNHRCDDAVGCRIIVSEGDARKSLKPGYWPDGMSCRRWEDRPRRRDMQQTRYRGQEPRSSRYFYRRDTDDRHYA